MVSLPKVGLKTGSFKINCIQLVLGVSTTSTICSGTSFIPISKRTSWEGADMLAFKVSLRVETFSNNCTQLVAFMPKIFKITSILKGNLGVQDCRSFCAISVPITFTICTPLHSILKDPGNRSCGRRAAVVDYIENLEYFIQFSRFVVLTSPSLI